MQNIVETNIRFTKTENCASALVKELINQGVDSIFGYPGASVLSVYNELEKEKKLKHYLVRHEQAALHAAEGFARASGRTGVVLVTSGPGFTNTITGIANAYADSTPLVILAGDVAATNKKGKIFQNIDIPSLTESTAKKTYIFKEGDDIKNIVKEAFLIANTDSKGPVVIVLPRNLLESNYIESRSVNLSLQKYKQNFEFEADKLSSLINSSKKPLVLIGGGAINAAREVINFASCINAPVVSTLMGIGIYPSSDKSYLGMIGLNGSYIANSTLNQCDLLISFGVSFSDRSRCKNIDFAKKSKIVSINIASVSKNFELEIEADTKEFLTEFLSKNQNFDSHLDWFNKIDIIKTENTEIERNSEKLHSSYVLRTLSEYTKKYSPIVVTDVGQHQMLTAQFFDFNKPRRFITSGGMGTMGFGLPASIGAQLALPDNLVLNITGDGSFQMNLQELATCREHNIPIKIIIMNNGYLGMVRQLQEKIYNSTYQVEMTNPDFTKIAEAYDLFAVRVETKEELIPAIKKAISYNGTAIVDIMIDSFENI